MIANDTPDGTPSDFHHDASDSAHVVHPSLERFSPRRGHFKHDRYIVLLTQLLLYNHFTTADFTSFSSRRGTIAHAPPRRKTYFFFFFLENNRNMIFFVYAYEHVSFLIEKQSLFFFFLSFEYFVVDYRLALIVNDYVRFYGTYRSYKSIRARAKTTFAGIIVLVITKETNKYIPTHMCTCFIAVDKHIVKVRVNINVTIHFLRDSL